jgi:2,3-bisphosphoglycerate-independent phosphoglycerate mutase
MMNLQTLVNEIALPDGKKIVFMVMDGVGDLPAGPESLSPLEKAATPNLDRFVSESALGCIIPIARGITPGSGPAHLALFGYDPLQYRIGRGLLAALGIDFPVEPGDVAARINFATVNQEGIVVDRRAGRISTDFNRELCGRLDGIEVEGSAVSVRTVKEHRAVAVFRGENLAGDIKDTDPQKTGLKPLPVESVSSEEKSLRMVRVVRDFLERAEEMLSDTHPANAILMRGFDMYRVLPSMSDIYRLNCAAVASYPMYRGVAKLVGMVSLPGGDTLKSEIDAMKEHWNDYDFFFFHFKNTDSSGEDGDFEAKVRAIEMFDSILPELPDLENTVLAVTGDHSTPVAMKSHSWHSVPFLLRSPYVRKVSRNARFTERNCQCGELGTFPSREIMPLLMAHAGRLEKFGA